jgi:hemerythrin-like metal-binding protein
MYINWDSKFETGIEKIDKQHKQLVDILNKLYDNVVVDKSGSAVNELLMDLKIYTISHFSVEEKLFKKYKYPEETVHIKLHKKFIDTISEYLFDVESTSLEQGYTLIEFLKNWLLNHILTHDMKYVLYLKKQPDFLADIKKDI